MTVPLTSCLTGLDQCVLQIKTKIVSCHTADSKPVKQEVNGTVILPPLVFHVAALIASLKNKLHLENIQFISQYIHKVHNNKQTSMILFSLFVPDKNFKIFCICHSIHFSCKQFPNINRRYLCGSLVQLPIIPRKEESTFKKIFSSTANHTQPKKQISMREFILAANYHQTKQWTAMRKFVIVANFIHTKRIQINGIIQFSCQLYPD